MDLSHYPMFSGLFEMPGPGFRVGVARLAALLHDGYPEAAAELRHFGDLLPPVDQNALEELFVRTFEIQAITTLDIGYTLYGEDYKRGALLAGLSREHREANNDCGTELADHLSNILRLLPKMADAGIREEVVREFLGPAVREMLQEFEPARIAKKESIYSKHHKTIIDHAEAEQRVAYRFALNALFEVLRKDFTLKVSLPIAQNGGFEQSIGTEMGVEGCAPCATNS